MSAIRTIRVTVARNARINGSSLRGLQSRKSVFEAQPSHRAMSSSAPASSSSQGGFIWQVGGALIVLSGIGYLLNRPTADPKAAAANTHLNQKASNPVDDDVAASIKQSMAADAPKTAKAAEESAPAKASTPSTTGTGDSSLKSSINAAIGADVPKSAEPAEPSSSSESNDVTASMQQALSADTPKAAKKNEESSKDDVGASINQAMNADAPKTAKKAEGA